jgi:hypothetical protein
MGSNYPDKRELDGAAVQRADLIVVDDLSVTRMESGDLLSPDAKVDWSAVRALAGVVAGQDAPVPIRSLCSNRKASGSRIWLSPAGCSSWQNRRAPASKLRWFRITIPSSSPQDRQG